MKIKLGQLRRVIQEERQRLVEAPKKGRRKKPQPIVMATIDPQDVSKWDAAARQLRVKGYLKFDTSPSGGTDVIYKGFGPPSADRSHSNRLLRKLKPMVDKMGSEEAASPVSDAKVYKLLTYAFTSEIHPDDVPLIRYQALKNAVRMTDYDGMLGNMDAGVGRGDLEHFGISARQLGDWLAAHGAKKMLVRRRKRPQMFSPYD